MGYASLWILMPRWIVTSKDVVRTRQILLYEPTATSSTKKWLEKYSGILKKNYANTTHSRTKAAGPKQTIHAQSTHYYTTYFQRWTQYLFQVFAVKETGRLLLKMIFRDRSLCDPPTNSCAENKKSQQKIKTTKQKGKIFILWNSKNYYKFSNSNNYIVSHITQVEVSTILISGIFFLLYSSQ